MKHLALAAIVAAAIAPAAMASPYGQTLTTADLATIHLIVPLANLSNLNPTQVAALVGALDTREHGEIAPQVRSILN